MVIYFKLLQTNPTLRLWLYNHTELKYYKATNSSTSTHTH